MINKNMALYLAYDSLIESNIHLPELIAGNGRQPDYTFRLLSPSTGAINDYDWFHDWKQDDGTIWLAYARHDGKYILRFPEYADFFVTFDGRKIDCVPRPDVPMETIRHFFLDQVLPSLVSRSGGLVLHASAVVIDNGAVLFWGNSGLGKSTLAASFSREGFPVMSDDGVLITEKDGKLICTPSYPGLRLWSESVSALYQGRGLFPAVAHYTDKRRLSIENGSFSFFNESIPLRQIYFLSPPTKNNNKGISIMPTNPREAFRIASTNTYRLDVTDRWEIQHHFNFISKILAATTPHRLAFQRGFSLLPTVKRAILANLRAVPASFAIEKA